MSNFGVQVLFSIDDIKAALRRRGPDSIGSKNVFIRLNNSSFAGVEQDISLADDEDFHHCSIYCDYIHSVNQESCGDANGFNHHGELQFIGATLQLRGIKPIVQPLVLFGSILVYNGTMNNNQFLVPCFFITLSELYAIDHTIC